MSHQAKAIIAGVVANKDKLRTTPNGFLGLSVRCQMPRHDGNMGTTYYDVKWFAPDSHEIAAQFQPGDEVFVTARIAKEWVYKPGYKQPEKKDKDTGNWVLQLVGESCRLAGEVGDIAAQFDAKPVADSESDIPF